MPVYCSLFSRTTLNGYSLGNVSNYNRTCAHYCIATDKDPLFDNNACTNKTVFSNGNISTKNCSRAYMCITADNALMFYYSTGVRNHAFTDFRRWIYGNSSTYHDSRGMDLCGIAYHCRIMNDF